MDSYGAQCTQWGATSTTQFSAVDQEQQDNKLNFSDLDHLCTLVFSDISLSGLLDLLSDHRKESTGSSERRSYSPTQDCVLVQDDPHTEVTERPRKRRYQAAQTHNFTEKRRRDKIKAKMKVLRELIPNSQKLDRASLLDKAISRIKKLQRQLQILQGMNSYPYIVSPLSYTTTTQLSPYASPMSSNIGFGTGLDANLALGMIPYNLHLWRSVSGNFMPMPSLPTNPYFQPPADSTSMQPQFFSSGVNHY